MAKKKKTAEKRKKQKEQEQQKLLLSMNEKELLNEGDRLFATGHIRDSIKIYQMALKISETAESQDIVKTKLFIAYATRSNELKDKNMLSEAKTLEQQALASSPHPSSMNASQISLFFKLSSPEKAFEAYNAFYSKNGAVSSLERQLAEILIKHHCWDKVEILHNDSILRKEAPLIQPAVLLMDSGEWNEALEKMKFLPRSSPFAHIRLFCRAMSAFYNGNDSEMLKAISMIPKDSIFIRITNILKDSIKQNYEVTNKQNDQVANKQNDQVANRKPSQKDRNRLEDLDNKDLDAHLLHTVECDLSIKKCLWSGLFEIQEKVNTIISLAKKEEYSEYLRKAILDFATLLMPEHVESVILFILETLLEANINNEREFFKMAHKLIKTKAELLRLKRNIVFVIEPLSSTLEYFKHIDKEFLNLDEQNIAKAMIIHHIAVIIFKSRDYSLVKHEKKNVLQFLGIKSLHNIAGTILDLITFGNKIDPQNRDLYDLAIKIPLSNREETNILENILISKCAAFPDDPEPCLKLASLYHEKNAYRKAESTLQRALKLAPYDSRVMDQHVISLLISADKSVTKKKFHLVWQDLEKIKKFDSKHCALLITEKSLFYKIAETGIVNESEIETKINLLPLSDQLKCYAMLLIDITEKLEGANKKQSSNTKSNSKNIGSSNPHQIVQTLFRKGLSRLEELTSWDLLNLLLPFPEEWRLLFKRKNLILFFINNSNSSGNDIFSKHCTISILPKLDDHDFLTLIEKINDRPVFSIFITELQRRINELEKIIDKSKKKTNKSKRGASKPEQGTDKLEQETNKTKQGTDKTKQGTDKSEKITESEIAIKIAKKATYDIFRFYKITLNNIIRPSYSYLEYVNLIEDVEPETEKKLKEAAKKLSQKATGYLREALEQFNFEILSYYRSSTFNSILDLFDFFDDDDDD